MSANSDRLAKAISQLPFVVAIEHEQQQSAVNVLCRIKPGCGASWALTAERILREALKRQGTADYWHTHIARVYMIRDNKFVYGWTFVVMSDNPDKTVSIVSGILDKLSQEIATKAPQTSPQNATPRLRAKPTAPPPPSDLDDDESIEFNKNEFKEDDDYTDAEEPLPKGAVPEADAQGNPIVPRSARVHKVRMAGLPKDYDRNAPDPDIRKGSWSIEGRGRPFRPPVRN